MYLCTCVYTCQFDIFLILQELYYIVRTIVYNTTGIIYHFPHMARSASTDKNRVFGIIDVATSIGIDRTFTTHSSCNNPILHFLFGASPDPSGGGEEEKRCKIIPCFSLAFSAMCCHRGCFKKNEAAPTFCTALMH